ncbi:YqaE/Pmp3 family membrane protein [Psychrobacillus sp. FSL K6-2843]|uniref:YqaE/Pmp3 family membrane protein n=1 Tax=Psychrobacillus sp. FSL K6-2843 TaxID=2921549 RepID=UPI00315A377D
MYFLAVFLPPVAVLLSGKPIQALLNFVLTLFFWIPGIIHAVLVVKDNKDNKRMKQQAEIIANAHKNK